MLSYKDSLNVLKKTKALIKGHFVLSSGMHSNQYIQCAKLLSNPQQAELICASLCEKIKKVYKKIDIVLSPAIGGIVVGYEVGRQLSIQTIFAERLNGKMTLRRGFEIPKNKNILIIEDVVTTGKAALECNEIIKQHDSKLVGYACIVDRSTSELLIKDKIISQIKLKIETYKTNQLPGQLKKIIPIKPGSRN